MIFKSNLSKQSNQKAVSLDLSDRLLDKMTKRAVKKVNYFINRTNVFAKQIEEDTKNGNHTPYHIRDNMATSSKNLKFWKQRLEDLSFVATERILLDEDTDTKDE